MPSLLASHRAPDLGGPGGRLVQHGSSFNVVTRRSRIRIRPVDDHRPGRRRRRSRRRGARADRTSASARAVRIETRSGRRACRARATRASRPSRSPVAPSMVAIRIAVAAGSARGSLRVQLLQKGRLAHRLEHVEVVVAGSTVGAEADGHAGALHLVTGAAPLASFMLLSGLCDTATRRLAENARCPPGVRWTPCAASVRSPRSRSTRGTASASSCICPARPCARRRLGEVDDDRRRSRSATARIVLSVAASSVYIECGAIAGTIRSSVLPLLDERGRAGDAVGRRLRVRHRELDDRLAEHAANARFLRRLRRSPPRSNTCPRMRSCPTESFPAPRAGCRRARISGLTVFASAGKMYFCSHSISARSSARPR